MKDTKTIRQAIGILMLASFTVVVTPACNSNSGNTTQTANDSVPKALESQTGLASYYGRGFEGQETASGKTFDSDEMVAAHPTYPLNTMVHVTNLENSKSVDVKIIDRGPTDENRQEGVIIDLSKGAGHQLGMVKDGRVKVKVDVTQWGDDKRQ